MPASLPAWCSHLWFFDVFRLTTYAAPRSFSMKLLERSWDPIDRPGNDFSHGLQLDSRWLDMVGPLDDAYKFIHMQIGIGKRPF